MENYFKKLSAINVKGMAEKKGRFNYLSWANAWALIKENHPEANTAIQRSTAKAIAMHGLGISIFKGEDLVDIATPPPAPSKPVHVVLDLGDNDMKKTLDWIALNKSMGLPKIVKTLEQKYKITAKVKKEIANIIKQ